MHRSTSQGGCIALAIVLLVAVGLTGCSGPTTPEPAPVKPAAVLSIDSVATLGGRNVDVPIRISYPDDPASQLDHLGGFDLVLRYDVPGLTLVDIQRGQDLEQWEYFTWRTYGFTNDTGTTEYSVRIVSIRDMNNGVLPDPPQYYPEGIVGVVTFWVTSDRNYFGTTSEIRFYSTSCSDNTLTPQSDNRTYYMADARFGPDSDDAVVDTMGCIRRYSLVPALEFHHGKVTIEEPPPIAGDVNLNGIPFDFGDLVIFLQLFDGRTPDIDPELIPLAIANADCNRDGETLTVADYDYLIHVMFGDTEASDPLPPPYAENLNLELVKDGKYWLLAGTSSSPVSGLSFKMVSIHGSTLDAEWIGGYHASFGASFQEDTLRGIAFPSINNIVPVLEGDWPPPIRIRNADGTRPVIVDVEASTPPGVLMNVTIHQ